MQPITGLAVVKRLCVASIESKFSYQLHTVQTGPCQKDRGTADITIGDNQASSSLFEGHIIKHWMTIKDEIVDINGKKINLSFTIKT